MITLSSYPSGTVFLNDLQDISFGIGSASRAKVTVTALGRTLYDETLWPIGGAVTLHDLPSLLHASCRSGLQVTYAVTISELDTTGTVATRTISFTAVYANVETGQTASAFLASRFLTIFEGARRTAPGRKEYLSYIGSETASVTARYADGSTQTFTPQVTQTSGSYRQIDVSPGNYASSSSALARYTVTCGSRSMTYDMDYLHPDAAPIIMFENSFGVDEIFYCVGKHEVSGEYTRYSTLLQSGMTRNYRTDEVRRFTAATGVLTRPEAAWLDELFRSEEVYVCNVISGTLSRTKEITILESESKNDNSDDTLPEFTFSYRYAQRQQNVMQTDSLGRIFDNTFDSTFE